ncbi:hypothetical protein [uncultured Shewanella sp.]|uniref:hypothetical protein n=1 Tax=uncultured Shewanella sp. TaxID=173975 RepID=UPI00262EBC72|nr:hypothetical protein [uncultured Shewanella sp.]
MNDLYTSTIFETLIGELNKLSKNAELIVMNNCASCRVNNQFDMHLIYLEETQTVHIVSYIQVLDDNTRMSVYETLLEANFLATREGAFAITPDRHYFTYNESRCIYQVSPFELDIMMSRVIQISQKTLSINSVISSN